MVDQPPKDDGPTPLAVVSNHHHGRFGWWGNRSLRLAVLVAIGLLLVGGMTAGYSYTRNRSASPPAGTVSDANQPLNQLPAADGGGGSQAPKTSGSAPTASPSANKPAAPKTLSTPKTTTSTAKTGGTATPSPPPSPTPSTPPPSPPPPPPVTNFSLRFFGTGANDIDRVKIPLTPNKSIDVGGNFTLEWWMKTASGNGASGCTPGAVNWISGNILFDRDIAGNGDYGDYGISLYNDGIAFGVAVGGNENTICSTVSVSDGAWHHVAATRNSSSGQLCLYVDGTQRGCGSGPTGDMSYRDARSITSVHDPFLVIAAEKHDAGPGYPSFSGWIDEVRVSNSVRYTSNFTRPAGVLGADAATVALYAFNSGSGTTAVDTTGGNPGTLMVDGISNGPQWSSDAPF